MEKTTPPWHLLTPNIRRLWANLFITPLSWLFLCFFQPARFSEQFEYPGIAGRFTLMFRRAIPLFLLILLVALPVQVLLLCTHSCSVPSLFTWSTLRPIFFATLF